jgi:hypothetical protein
MSRLRKQYGSLAETELAFGKTLVQTQRVDRSQSELLKDIECRKFCAGLGYEISDCRRN